MLINLFAIGDPRAPGFTQDIYQGLLNSGCQVRHLNPNPWAETDFEKYSCDAAIAIGYRHRIPEISKYFLERSVPFFVIDAGHIDRGKFWQVNPYQLNWIPPVDVPNDRAQLLSVDLEADFLKRDKDGHILIMAQKFNDAQHGMDHVRMQAWIKEQIKLIEEFTDAPIVIRNHPNNNPYEFEGGENQDPHEVPLLEALKAARAVVVYNSTSGLDALLHGIPVFCNPKAHYAHLARTSYETIDDPAEIDRDAVQKHVNRVAYAQWSREELGSLKPYEFIISVLNGEYKVEHSGVDLQNDEPSQLGTPEDTSVSEDSSGDSSSGDTVAPSTAEIAGDDGSDDESISRKATSSRSKSSKSKSSTSTR